MSAEEDLLDDLAGAVLDGTDVDWAAAGSQAGGHARLLKHLQLVESVSRVHQTALSGVSPASPSSTQIAPPDRWGHLQLLEPVGEGAFGEVFRAFDTRLGREVALKLLPVSDAPDESTGSSIIREGQLLARVRHPNVATIYGAERIAGRVGLWMEFVRGNTLEHAIKHGRVFTAAETTAIGLELCRAVTAVHDAGLVHRDIKAANVMLADDGRVVLTDFGTGQELEHQPGEGLAGTPLYLAPELLRGQEATVRSDIYSVGVLLYHLLTRSYPVRASSIAELRSAHGSDVRQSLRAARPDLPSRLVAVIDRAIDPQPSKRYENATSLAAALTAMSPGGSARRWRMAIAVGGLALAVAGVLVYNVRRSSGPAIDVTASGGGPVVTGMRKITESGQAVDGGLSPDGSFIVYIVDEGGRASIWHRQLANDNNHQLLPADEVLYWKPTISPDGQTLYFLRSRRDTPRLALYRMPVSGSEAPRLLHEHADLMGALALSPDGRSLALIKNSQSRDESTVVIVDDNGGGERILARRKHSAAYWRVAWSPDGRTLAAVAGNADSAGRKMNIVSLNVADGTEQPVTTESMAYLGDLGWLADGSGVLAVATPALPRTDQIWHVSYPAGVPRAVTDDAARFADVSLAGDSRAVLARQIRRRREIWVGSVATSSSAPLIESATAKAITSGYMRLSWAPDGRMLYTSMASGSEQIWRMRPDGTSPQQLTRDGLNADPVATPDGQAIVFASIRGDVQHLWAMDADGGNARQLTNGSGETKPQVTPDGRFVIFNATMDFSTWRVPLSGGAPERLTDSYAREPAIAHDGSLMAYNFRDRQAAQQWKIVVAPAGGGQPLKVFDRQRGDYQTMELNWTPDGRSITYEVSQRGVSNIWAQPLAGGAPVQLTHFTADYIYGFAWSRPDNQLAVVRGDWDSDILLLSLKR